MSKLMSRLVALTAFTALAAGPALAQRPDPGVHGPVSGTVSMTAKGAAVGVGYTWGEGALRYGGRTYHFTVNGVTIADVGFSRVTGRGRVYNLHRLQDFSGTYAAATGEATAGSGIGGQVLKNANGVEIRVDQVTRAPGFRARRMGSSSR